MKHTPGPWIADKSDYKGHDFKRGFLGVIRTRKGVIRTRKKGRPIEIYSGPFSFQSLGGRTENEADANARLIAAAPELYEMLKEYPWECTCKEDGIEQGSCYGCKVVNLIESLEAQ